MTIELLFIITLILSNVFLMIISETLRSFMPMARYAFKYLEEMQFDLLFTNPNFTNPLCHRHDYN